MYYENNNHYLLIYGKLPKSILINAMPLSYKFDGGDYITTIFVNGKDYIGQSTYDNISKTIKQDNIIDIINNNYDEVKKVLPELTIDEYNENLEFSKKQLEIISKNQTYNVVEENLIDFINNNYDEVKKILEDNEELEIIQKQLEIFIKNYETKS